MIFQATRTVRFADCDPAGIVFYPHYMVMLNTLVEQWFDEGLHLPYAHLIGQQRMGLPTVRLEVDFTAPSRHGDVLTQQLSLRRLGRSSLGLRIGFSGGTELRLRALQVLVCTGLDNHRPRPLPDGLRAAMAPYLETDS